MHLKIMSAAVIAGAALYGGYATPALAADLGGDCCADLEERVAELEATTARKGNRRVSLEIYGQVNTAVMFWDDGDDSDAFVIDNQTSNSRFGLRGSAKINPNLSAGFLIEVAVGLGAESSRVEQDNDDGSAPGDSNVSVRHANWWLSHKGLGKLSVGRLSHATDSIGEIDLGGANIVAQYGIYFANDFQVIGDGRTWDQFATDMDFSRGNAVRYDTPTIGGFTASTSWGEDDRWDVALRYAGEMAGFRLAAGIGYGVDTDELEPVAATDVEERRTLLGSVSVLHVASGLFLSGSAGTRENDLLGGGDFDEDNWSLRGGISKNWFGLGKTVLYGEYQNWQNLNDLDSDMDIWGLGVVQNIDAAAMELYLAYKNYSVDIPGTDTEDLDLVISGARIRF